MTVTTTRGRMEDSDRKAPRCYVSGSDGLRKRLDHSQLGSSS
jgi:hypothetical protein